jgi:hypothetical protein
VPTRRGLHQALAIALVTAAIPGCGEGAETQPEPEGGPFFGVNGDLIFNLTIAGESALVDRHLDGIRELRVAFVRSQADWRRLEPLPPGPAAHRDFSITDRWVEQLARHGLAWQVLGNGRPTPRWAADPGAYRTCGSDATPEDADDFAAHMAALAARYGSRGTFWTEHPELPRLPTSVYEVWNEPNHFAFWCPTPDPQAYAQLLARTAIAIRQADPRAQVLVGGLAAFEPTSGDRTPARMGFVQFLERAFDDPALRAVGIDGVAVHPYAPTPAAALAQVEEFRAAVDAAGLAGVPLHVNEAGWPTAGGGGTSTPETVRATYLGELASALRAGRERLGLASFAPYSWATREQDPADPLDWLGIADPATARPYPTALAYAAAIRDTAAAE